MHGHYILNDDHSVEEVDLMEWAVWFENNPAKRVLRQDETKFCWLSTVFLGLDHQFGVGPPLLFETMGFTREKTLYPLFGRKQEIREELNSIFDRYSTWDQAMAGHLVWLGQIQQWEADAEAASTAFIPTKAPRIFA